MFFGIICCALLIIGGVEVNPGPVGEKTLEDVWNKLSVLDTMQQDMGDIKASIGSVSGEIAGLRCELLTLKEECQTLRTERDSLLEKVDRLENFSRRSNLVFYNVEEGNKESWEDTEHRLRDVISETMDVKLDKYDIERAHRVGRPGNWSRPIVVKFSNYKKKNEVMDGKRHLKGTRIGVSEDFSEKVRGIRRELKVYMQNAKDKGHRAQLRFDKLVVDGRHYTLKELQHRNAPSTRDTDGGTGMVTSQRATTRSRQDHEQDQDHNQDQDRGGDQEAVGGPERRTRPTGNVRDWLTAAGPVTRAQSSVQDRRNK